MDSALIHGNCLEELKKLPENSIQTCVTSPPYWNLRNYGVVGQIGLEKSPDEFIKSLVGVFREVRRVLKKDGTLWVNIGDSYAVSGKGGAGSYEKDRRDFKAQGKTTRKPPEGLKNKDLVGIPWMLAFALRADGWYLRQEIIWHKPNPMPESIKDRCTKSHEQIFLLTKSDKYFFDHKSIQERALCEGMKLPDPSGWMQGEGAHETIKHQGAERHRKARTSATKEELNGKNPHSFRALVEKRNKRSVWTVASSPFKGAHFATFPPKLIEPCILAGSKPGDFVLDPFNGSGTTGAVALTRGRKYIGIELNKEYLMLTRNRFQKLLIQKENRV
jgi:DNA modification methylase